LSNKGQIIGGHFGEVKQLQAVVLQARFDLTVVLVPNLWIL
jgi:hypothetical protein